MELAQCALYVAVIGIASHFIGHMLPREWFDPESCLFRPRAWEDNGKFYKKLNVRIWKDKLPDASRRSKHMYRKRVDIQPTEENLNRMVQETCVAEFIHILLIVLSLGVIKIWKGKNGLFCWLLCLLGNLPFIIIQRFNRPRLQNALERLKTHRIAP